MKKRLVTSALPYVNNVPHLGNLIQVLSADAFARFCRLAGYETLYICGTDEYGTATETKAAQEGLTPQQLCDRYHAIHADIYKWFDIAFDKFGRTSTPVQTAVTQDIFQKLDKAGYISEKTIEQFFCSNCSRFLADRYIRGTCPHCGSAEARGDQCEACQKLLDPTDLKEPQCSVCAGTPSLQKTNHLYINLPAIREKLEDWIKTASVKGFWANNAIQMTNAWIRDGLKERAITRDLKWGIPVPRPGYENKVFYVWFDACIGYISITGNLGEEIVNGGKAGNCAQFKHWQDFVNYWWKSPDETDLFQFIGKDNIPFHTVIFPSSLLGSCDTGGRWTMLHHMSSTEYLNYENGKFSKSRGVGVFGTDAMETGIPADVWRFYIFYNRPEKSDAQFTWKDFQEKVNSELIGNLGNLVNRTLTFVTRYYDGNIPQAENNGASGGCDASCGAFWEEAVKREKSIAEKLDKAELRDAFREVFELSSFANKYFQDNEPWRLRNDDPQKAQAVIRGLTFLVRDLSVLIEPYMPAAASRIASFFDLKLGSSFNWNSIGKASGPGENAVIKSEVLFTRLENEQIDALRERYSGNQKEREEAKPSFSAVMDLRAAKIEKIERHPKADKLYVINLETAEGVYGVREERQIVSGLVPFYTEEQLLGKKIIVAYNLKPAKLRGIESRGMLLAAGDKGGVDPEGTAAERVEVLDASSFPTGTRLLPEGEEGSAAPVEIDIDAFFSHPITVKNYEVLCADGKKLCLDGKPVRTAVISDGEVH
ncbi:MAG: methionine--tRNA ligase [Treponema sp.]|jgi:methionyl-tRNA synthetase|nr:methionine--tRNA ligase [Treponema sp.]